MVIGGEQIKEDEKGLAIRFYAGKGTSVGQGDTCGSWKKEEEECCRERGKKWTHRFTWVMVRSANSKGRGISFIARDLGSYLYFK